jgi:hypothetical protein
MKKGAEIPSNGFNDEMDYDLVGDVIWISYLLLSTYSMDTKICGRFS